MRLRDQLPSRAAQPEETTHVAPPILQVQLVTLLTSSSCWHPTRTKWSHFTNAIRNTSSANRLLSLA